MNGREPLVSIIWVNYNSMPIIDLVLTSLRGFKNLNYTNYELIIVDNASFDGSFEIIKRHVETWSKPKIKIIRLTTNKGYMGACSEGFKAIEGGAEYVAISNNDFIPVADSLRLLVERMESERVVGGAQGVVLDYETKLVDSAGYILDELLRPHPLFRFKDPTVIKGDFSVTYAYGAYSLYKVDAVRRARNIGTIFDPELFAFIDDIMLGLRLWMEGYKVKSYPIIAGLHYRGATMRGGGLLRSYLGLRNYLALVMASNSRWKEYSVLYALARASTYGILGSQKGVIGYLMYRALRKAMKVAKLILEREGIIDVYKAPLIKMSPLEVITSILAPARLIRLKADYIIARMWQASTSTLETLAGR